MAMTFSPRSKPPQRKPRTVGANETELGSAARGKSFQDYSTKPGYKGGDDEPFQKLVRFGRRVGKKVLGGLEKLTGTRY